jgi:2-dehydro-3-deoxygalactonokinase
MSTPALLALDWGTSNLRATLLAADGSPLQHRATPGGVMSVTDGRFAEVLMRLCGDWLEAHPVPVIASGMIGSRQGWREAPYLPCPATLPEAAERLVRVPLTGRSTLHIVPGLAIRHADGTYDVMRGEETQLWGTRPAEGSCCVLPGTHSKWAWMGQAGRIERFETYMTGELYGLLTRHSILGRLMQHGTAAPDAFEDGVRLGLRDHRRASHAIFSARTAGLMNRWAPTALPDYLSGILIGIEIAGARESGGVHDIVLIGDEDLCVRYTRALSLAGLDAVRAAEGVTLDGQWAIARQAGLVDARA